MKKLLAVIAAVPLLALAAPPAGGPDAAARRDRLERRMRLARVLGFAEALDLDEAQASQLRLVLARFDERRVLLRRQLRESMRLLRRAAAGDPAVQGQVDHAVAQMFDARAQLQATDREMLQALSRDLTPEKRARAAIFLSHFQRWFGGGLRPGAGRGPGGAMGRGPAGRGGPGMEGGPGSAEECPDDDCPPQ